MKWIIFNFCTCSGEILVNLSRISLYVQAISVIVTPVRVTVYWSPKGPSHTENHRIEWQSLTVTLFRFRSTVTVTDNACINVLVEVTYQESSPDWNGILLLDGAEVAGLAVEGRGVGRPGVGRGGEGQGRAEHAHQGEGAGEEENAKWRTRFI